MSVYHRSTAKSRILQEYRNREEEIAAAFSRQMSGHKNGVESEKRIRREIANSNERRRMQSINAGFQVLRSLLPHNEGEKLSKAAILQQTTEFINNLQQEKAKVVAQNAYFKRILNEVSRRCNIDLEADISLYVGSPPLKRKKRDTESSDEGIMADYEDLKYEDIKREVLDLRQKLEQEKQLRMILELRARTLDTHQYAEKVESVDMHVEPKVCETKDERIKEEIRRDEASVPMQVDVETDHRVPSSPLHRPEHMDSNMASSMSRRNLETIVEAIRHLEGEGEVSEVEQAPPTPCHKAAHQRLTESGHPKWFIPKRVVDSDEHSYHVQSDQDDIRSESSGRDSPSATRHYIRLHSANNLQHVHPTESKVVVSSYSDKYPAVTNVLQGNSPQLQMYCRPGVIVQKS